MDNQTVQALELPLDWGQVKQDWDALLERQENERASFIRDLARRASRQEIAEKLGLTFQHVAHLLDYDGVVEKLSTAVDNSEPPTEWELRPYIEQAAAEVADQRGVERVRRDREEVYSRAAELYERRNVAAPQTAPPVAPGRGFTGYSSATDEWATPQDLFDELDREFSFDLDVCASPENAKAASYYDRAMDGLKQEWWGSCWMNPPYGDEISKWVHKAYEAAQSIDVEAVVCLVPARVDTNWWWDYCRWGEVRFIKGRLKFGGSDNSAPFPSAVVVFRRGQEASVKWWER